MGVFSIDADVKGLPDSAGFVPVRGLLVDSGSELTWLPSGALARAGVVVSKRGERFVTADGREIVRDVGYALLRCGAFETVDEVVFGLPGDLSLLGARTLEGFGARVDAREKRLVASGPHLVAACA